ncbi:hypothetical protein HWV62_41226 [Athelia sp. TMB]|nr:hypothetical protein HWV62_41226 [Athelia sp. TMB]
MAGSSTSTPPEEHKLDTPFPTKTTESPSDATETSDQKLSRKRERELSIEPSTPRPDIDDDVVAPSEGSYSGRRSPKKKNRTQLDSTEEEGAGSSRSRTPSPHPAPSPLHEVKVRQISQGVEDIECDDKLSGVNGAPIPPVDGPEATTPVAASGTPSTAEGLVNPDATTELSSDCTMKDSEKSPDSDGAEEKRLKRKLADRAVSHGPETAQAVGTDGATRAKTNDDNPRAKKRASPPRTPEASSEASRLTPPSTPPALDESKVAEKRRREDADKDDNPRQTKKPSPPPDVAAPEIKDSIMTTPKPSGFMAYASTSSPFASAKGPNIFGSRTKTSSFFKVTSPPPSPAPVFAQSSFGKPNSPEPMPTTPTASKRSGFEAFAGSASPFVTASKPSSSALRSKSPPRTRAPASRNTSAFTSYASGGAQAFAVPLTKRARASTPPNESSSSRSSLERNSTLSSFGSTEDVNGPAHHDKKRDEGQLSFGEKLRAGKNNEETTSDEETKPELTAQAVVTGEEDENIMYMVRAKLFHLSDQNAWKERGTGTLKLNVRKKDGEGARLVMRKEAVFTVLLNVTLFHGMSVFIAQDPRYVRLSVIEDGQTVHYNLRVASAKIGEELLEAVKAYIPPPSA